MDRQIIELFKRWQKKEGKYPDLDIGKVEFENIPLKKLHQKHLVKTVETTTADKFIEIGDIDRKTKKYDISTKTKNKLPKKAKHAPKGTILVSRVRPLLGGYTIIDGDDYTFTAGDLNPIVLPENVNVNYVFKLICSSVFRNFLIKNQDTGGQKPTITKKLYDFEVPLPQDYNEAYDSKIIQQAIVEFLDYRLGLTQATRNRIDSIQEKVELMDKIILPKIFEMKDEYLRDQFDKWAKKKNYKISANDLKFVIKRITSDNPEETVCEKRMGFTPKRDPNGDINWFTVADLNSIESLTIDNPDTKEKTTIELVKKAVDPKNTGRSVKLKPIQKGDILVSFKLSVGITKIYNSDKIAYCNEAIDILTCKKGYYNKYIAYNCIVEYPKHGTKTNNGMTLNDDSKQEIIIFIPKKTKAYSSEKIQHFLVEFIEAVHSRIFDIKSRINSIYKNLDLLEEAIPALTFRN